MDNRQLGHLAGADHQDALFLQAREDPRGEVHGHRGDADSPLADFGRLVDALGCAEGPVKQAVEVLARGLGLDGPDKGRLDLPDDLRLAEDHAVQAGGDLEQVARRLLSLEPVSQRSEFLDAHVVKLGQCRDEVIGRRRPVGRSPAIDLHAVARREDDEFGLVEPGPQDGQGSLDGRVVEGQPLPHLQRRRLMIHTHAQNLHFGNVHLQFFRQTRGPSTTATVWRRSPAP